MAKQDRKKSKSDEGRPKRTEPIVPLTNDPRFSTVHSDPRFALPKKRDRTVTIDSRFKKVLEDDDFARKAKVDKYGRRLLVDKRREEIKRLYTFEDEEDEENDDDDEGEMKIEEEEGKKGKKKKALEIAPASSDDEDEDEDEEDEEEELRYDPARGEGLLSDASSSDDDSDDESVVTSEAEDAEAAAREAEAVPLGDISSRIAVVNLDWDHIKSTDLFVVLSSFAPIGGKILNVSVYPSEFGKERMEREEMEGPPKEVFGLSSSAGPKKKKKQSKSKREEAMDDQEEVTEATLVKEDKGEEFDSAALRRYQLERLRYFYAIVTCDTPTTANAIYTECDGAEFATTANFFDLRFVPDDTEFDDRPRDECSEMPKNYKPLEFSTDALQHSKVKLTWDQEDATRKAAVKEAFSRREVEEMDLQAYLASDSDEETEDAKDAYRKMLNLGPSSEKVDKGEKKPVGDMEVTFSAALIGEDGKKNEIFERDETTIERYVRKERERKKARKEKMKEKRAETNGEKIEAPGSDEEEEEAEDLGFDDPFFENPEKVNTDSKKAKKQKRREEKAKVEAEQAAKREQLEALMANDETSELQHFNMNDILKQEKLAKLKGKAAKRMAKKKGVKEAEGLQGDYKMDVSDPRFSAIYEKTEFAIDPTNPRYKKTQAMEKVMEERRKRRAHDEPSDGKKKQRK